MKKVVLFLNQINYENYDFSQTPNRNQYYWVACVGPIAQERYGNLLHQHMDKVISVQEATDMAHRVIDHSLDFEEIAEHTEDLIEQAGGPENVIIVCADELNINLAGHLRDHFNIPGDGFIACDTYRNKALMKQSVKASNVRTPKYTTFDKLQAETNPKAYFEHIQKSITCPFIIKPTAGGGSFSTYKIENWEQFAHHLGDLIQNHFELEVEEFINGTMYHCDGIMNSTKILHAFPSIYSCPNLEFTTGKNLMSLPLHPKEAIYQKIIAFTHETIKALGYVTGAFHFEFFDKEDSGELVFIEIAARPPGALLSTNLNRQFGLNLFNADYCLKSGEFFEYFERPIEQYSFSGFAPNQHGEVAALNTPTVQGEIECNWLVKIGDHLHHPTSLPDRCVTFIVCNKDYEQLKTDMYKLESFPFITMKDQKT